MTGAGKAVSTVVVIIASALTVASAAPAVVPVSAEASAHRALYAMTLDHADSTSSVDGATGTLYYEWGDVCDGWTVQQRYKLVIHYQQDPPVELTSNYLTWESKDGTSFRFNDRETRNGNLDQDIRGTAKLSARDHSGVAIFERPKPQRFNLAPGTLFPTAHTFALIEAGLSGRNYLAANVFDGSVVDGASQVSAVIGKTRQDNLDALPGGVKSPLLGHRNWPIWLAFFSDATKDATPDYALGMHMLENGVSSEMSIDYGDYVIKAQLKSIEALPKPGC
jgi:EipB-like